jgi:hypothetical protein
MKTVSLCGERTDFSRHEGKLMSTVFPAERIERVILVLRGHKIILDRDLAAMYGVSTRDLNKAVSRNIERFPDDFMLQLTRSEFNDLKFQFGT